MNELTPIGTDYQAVRAKIEGTILPKLAEFEEYSLAQLSKHVADEMRGIHVKNTANLMSLFTSDLYEDCVSAYGADTSSDDFVDFCLQELNDKIAFMSLVAWPVAYDREGAWSALSFHMPQWADKVSIIGEHASSNIGDVIQENGEFSPTQIDEISEAFSGDLDKAKAVYRDFTDGCATGMGMDDLLQIGREIAVGIPYTMTETAPPVPNPMTLEYLVEVFSNGYTKEQVEGFVEKLGLDEVAYMAEVHAKLRYKAIEEDPTAETERPENHRMLVDAFGGAFTEQEAVSNAVAFDWDVNRAANLYKNLTDGSASHMSVEDLISAGKETV